MQKFMKNRYYGITDCGGGGDCFFLVIWCAYNKAAKYSVSELRKIVSNEATPEIFETYKKLYNDFVISIKTNEEKIKEIELDSELKKLSKEMTDLTDRNKKLKLSFKKKMKQNDRDEAARIINRGKLVILKFKETKEKFKDRKKKNNEQIKEMENENDLSRELMSEHEFMKNINSLREFKNIIKKSIFWADTWAISTIERILNIKIIIFSKEKYTQENYKNVLLCGQINDELKATDIINPAHYIMVEHSGDHYRLITYKNKKTLQFNDIPFYIKKMIVDNCMKSDSGIYTHIPDFKQIKNTELRMKGSAAEKIQRKWRSSQLYDKNIIFQFYSKSSTKPPGKGNGEKGDPKQFKKLGSLDKNWRRVLSNFHTNIENEIQKPLFKFKGLEWASVEHAYHAGKFIKKNNNFYEKFSWDSGSPFAKDPLKAKAAGGKTGIYREKKKGTKKTETTIYRRKDIKMDEDFNYNDWMASVLEAKFTQNKKAKDILLATKQATLIHYVSTRGQKNKQSKEKWVHLMKIRKKLSKKK